MHTFTALSMSPLQRWLARRAVVAAVLVLTPFCSTPAFAQTPRLVVKALGAGTLGSQVDRTALVGGGVALEASPLVQLFAEGTWEVGHAYPADTMAPPSSRLSTGVPVAVVILNTPFEGIRRRVNAVYFGGVRLITPSDRTVRTFVDAGIGVARFKGTETAYPDNRLLGYYTETQSVWGVGGGFSTTRNERWVFEGEYRWCHPTSEIAGVPFHRVQADLGFSF